MYEFLAIFSAAMTLFNYVILIRIFHKITDMKKENKNNEKVG